MARRPKPTRIRMRPTSVAVVHNGIIENFRELRKSWKPRARSSPPRPTPKSSRIWSPAPEARQGPVESGEESLPRLRGAFALAFIFKGEQNC
jgi:glucosamine--fructose-6-phosphate aminotransferase (isomerizing)